jgi:FkbM family methyltransferase
MNRLLKYFFNKKAKHALKQDIYARSSFSQEGEDMILAELMIGREKGFYVDVGAFHPSRFSNTKYFYDLGWRGINIEPSPNAIVVFQQERREDTNLNLGISDKEGHLNYFQFEEGALNTFDEDRVKFLEKETPYRSTHNQRIPLARLDSILEKYCNNRKIDFMNIDVEWHEMKVLQSNNWKKFRPSVLLVEILDFQLETISNNSVHMYLKEIGYKFECKTPRTCFYLDSLVK